MSAKRILTTVLAVSMVLSGTPPLWAQGPSPQAAPPPPAGAAPFQPGAEAQETGAQETGVTPARVSYIYGQVSFWRPGASEWAPAGLNTPLAPGDLLYTGPDGTVEVQIGARAFVRAASGTQLGLDNQEPDFIQFRVTAGHAAIDVRELAPGQTIELDTPNAAFTIEHAGYYGVDVGDDHSSVNARRGGRAIVTPVGGAAVTVSPDQQVVVTGTDSPRVEMAPQLAAWDLWSYQRTGQLLESPSARYVPPGVYGTQELDRYGSWRVVEAYGPVWVPSAVTRGWVPYSAGRWIWDPFYGWTWLDDAPWGWAPYHYGRWVFVGGFWAWAPGPVVVRPVYAPALVVFLDGPVIVGRPICWAPLAWGEPVMPWWGRPGFAGRPWWGGWGGPRVVNNVVINKTTVVNVTNITVYRNVNVTNAVVGVPADRFGRDHVAKVRVASVDTRWLEPVRGPLAVKPVAASVVPAVGPAVRPPESVVKRTVVATRPPRDVSATLRAEGLTPHPVVATPPTAPPGSYPAPSGQPPAPKLVPAPSRGGAAPGANDARRQTTEGKDPKQPKDGPPRVATTPPPTPAPPTPPVQTPPPLKRDRPTPPPLPQPERGAPEREKPGADPRTGRKEPPAPATRTPVPAPVPAAPPAPPLAQPERGGPEREKPGADPRTGRKEPPAPATRTPVPAPPPGPERGG